MRSSLLQTWYSQRNEPQFSKRLPNGCVGCNCEMPTTFVEIMTTLGDAQRKKDYAPKFSKKIWGGGRVWTKVYIKVWTIFFFNKISSWTNHKVTMRSKGRKKEGRKKKKVPWQTFVVRVCCVSKNIARVNIQKSCFCKNILYCKWSSSPQWFHMRRSCWKQMV